MRPGPDGRAPAQCPLRDDLHCSAKVWVSPRAGGRRAGAEWQPLGWQDMGAVPGSRRRGHTGQGAAAVIYVGVGVRDGRPIGAPQGHHLLVDLGLLAAGAVSLHGLGLRAVPAAHGQRAACYLACDGFVGIRGHLEPLPFPPGTHSSPNQLLKLADPADSSSGNLPWPPSTHSSWPRTHSWPTGLGAGSSSSMESLVHGSLPTPKWTLPTGALDTVSHLWPQLAQARLGGSGAPRNSADGPGERGAPLSPPFLLAGPS